MKSYEEVFNNGRSFYVCPFMGVLVAAAYFCKIVRNCSIYIFSDVIKSLANSKEVNKT